MRLPHLSAGVLIFLCSVILSGRSVDPPYITLTPPDVTELLQEDASISGGLKPFTFARNVETHLTQDHFIRSDMLGDTTLLRLGITIPGAYSLNLLFGYFLPCEGVTMYVSTPSQDYITGPYTTASASGMLHTAPVPGDSVLIELRLSPGVTAPGTIVLSQAGYGFRDIFGWRRKDSRYNSSGSCNIDINCGGWQTEKNAVVRLMYVDKLVTSYCTGTLINNTRFDGTPYILTANHCIHTQAVAGTTVAVFGYERAICNGSDGSTAKSISGAVVVATSGDIDFTLLRMDSKPPSSFNPYYAGWNRSSNNPPWGVCIHHPSGDVKKISTDYDAIYTGNDPLLGYDYNSYWKIVKWDIGVTENGSSGSPLFDPDHLIVGTLTGGSSYCGNPYEDYFTQLSLEYNKYSSSNSTHLKPWLDPIHSNVYKLGGYDPSQKLCDTINNLLAGDTITLAPAAGWGYLTGHNNFNDSVFAEKIFSSTPKILRGLLVDIAKADNGTFGSTITIKIWTGDSLPDKQIYSKDILLRNINAPGIIYHALDTFLILNSTFFIGYKINYTAGDTFAVNHTHNRLADTLNTLYLKTGALWTSFKSRNNYSTSLKTEAIFCDTTFLGTVMVRAATDPAQIIVYPNPAGRRFTIHLPNTADIIRIFGIDGVCVYSSSIPVSGNVEIELNLVKPGIYLIHVISGNLSQTAKIILKGS